MSIPTMIIGSNAGANSRFQKEGGGADPRILKGAGRRATIAIFSTSPSKKVNWPIESMHSLRDS